MILAAALLLAQDLPTEGVRRLAGHADAVKGVAWCPDGRRLVSAGRDRTLILWDAASGERIRTFEGHEGGVTSVAVSPDGRSIASGSQDKTVAVWDLETGRRLKTFRGHTLWVTSVAFSPDGRTIVSGSRDQSARLWPLDGGDPVVLPGQGQRLQVAVFTSDGKRVVTGSAEQVVAVWDAATGRQEARVSIGENAQWISLDPRSGRALAGAWNGSVFSVDLKGEAEIQQFKGHRGVVQSVDVDPDGLCYASGSQDEAVIVGDAATGKRLKRLFGHRGQVWSVAWSPSGRRLASGAEDASVVIWNPWKEARGGTAKEAVDALRAGDASARERLAAQEEDAAAAVLEAFPPGRLGPVAGEEKLRALLADLDSEAFATRAAAKKALGEKGPEILPWVEERLRADRDLTAEARGSLEDVRIKLRGAAGAPSSDGRERALRVLADLPRTKAVEDALRQYAEAPGDGPAGRIARRALGR